MLNRALNTSQQQSMTEAPVSAACSDYPYPQYLFARVVPCLAYASLEDVSHVQQFTDFPSAYQNRPKRLLVSERYTGLG